MLVNKTLNELQKQNSPLQIIHDRGYKNYYESVII